MDTALTALPEGRRGQILALALTTCFMGAVWVGCASPLINLYNQQAEELEHRRALLQHMNQVAGKLPELRSQAAQHRPVAAALLQGATDAVAGATLQAQVQSMATSAGASLISVETLPAEQRGAYRRIGLRVSLAAPWPVLIEFLRAAETGGSSRAGTPAAPPGPAMLIDDLQLRTSPLLQARSVGQPVSASLTIFAFRAG
ncbi:MAG: hypothetical protein JO110_22820, partial [Acetobacteraceae bacterium]|nr:hypothetical protein [Acetobacteraceae bacterium]